MRLRTGLNRSESFTEDCSPLYVQYGSGFDAPEGWLNFDASPTLLVERVPFVGARLSAHIKKNPKLFPKSVNYGDIVRGLPVPDRSCAGVYCSHVLEHLSLADCRAALRNTLRILKPAGVFRCVVPDLAHSAAVYLSDASPGAAHTFMRNTALGEETRSSALGLILAIFGHSRHRWMWDYPSLAAELLEAGFSRVRRAALGDSEHERFHAVERADRWESCLGVEAVR